ncbi:3-deoxy-7-phosphoheptulonate synthase [Streptomyces triticirhizae]|nr:3-deoxy-7-phosphoheptulonate synthase [Streptomyces triticirhizae]
MTTRHPGTTTLPTAPPRPAPRVEDDIARLRALPARQQPDWPDRSALRAALRSLPPGDLVTREDVDELRHELARLDAAGGLVLQLGDCVEDIDTDVPAATRAKVAFLTQVRSHLRTRTGRDIVAVGRLAGQYAKPRSAEFEVVDGQRLPAYRGPIVNAPEPTPEARRPSPARLALAHAAARSAHATLADHHRATARRDPI